MSYDINLKKTQLGYQFDRNVYIGYQTNDNRVVTVKELKGYVGGSSGGGGGGGGGGIQSITLGGGNGVVTLQVDQLNPQRVTVTNVVADDTAPSGAYICVIAPSETGYVVYPTDKTWSELLASIPQITWYSTDASKVLSIESSGTTTTLSIGAGLTKSTVDDVTTLSISDDVVTGLSVGSSGLTYTDGRSGSPHQLGGVIGTTAATTLSIATKISTSPSENDVVTVGYLQEQFQGGNVYSTENTPDGQQTSDKSTRFIFVEVD